MTLFRFPLEHNIWPNLLKYKWCHLNVFCEQKLSLLKVSLWLWHHVGRCCLAVTVPLTVFYHYFIQTAPSALASLDDSPSQTAKQTRTVAPLRPRELKVQVRGWKESIGEWRSPEEMSTKRSTLVAIITTIFLKIRKDAFCSYANLHSWAALKTNIFWTDKIQYLLYSCFNPGKSSPIFDWKADRL